MGFYIRKSLSAGPFRFNLSKSGLGVSAGVPGFRVGTGPRGNYVHMGANGVYYRSSLSSPMPGAQQQLVPQQMLPYSSDVSMEDITGSSIQQLVPSGPGELVTQLNEAATRFRWWIPTLITVIVIGLLIMPWGLIVWAVGGVATWWVWLRDKARRSVVVFYDVNDESATWFESMVVAERWLASSQRLWRHVQSGQITTVYQHKTNAGASNLVSRIPAKTNQIGPKQLVTNVVVPTIEAGTSRIHFLPDRVLLSEGKSFSDLTYLDLRIHTGTSRFIEGPGPVASDAEQVGQTWQYVNVKGGPDRRFANNPMLPIMKYGDIAIASDSGVRWELQASSVEATEHFSRALRDRRRLDATEA